MTATAAKGSKKEAREGYTSQEICAILEKSKEVGATFVKVAGLEIAFAAPAAVAMPRESGRHAGRVPKTPESSAPKEPVAASLLTPADHDAVAAIERAQTLIEDPLQFEQDQIDGFMTREQTLGGREDHPQ